MVLWLSSKRFRIPVFAYYYVKNRTMRNMCCQASDAGSYAYGLAGPPLSDGLVGPTHLQKTDSG